MNRYSFDSDAEYEMAMNRFELPVEKSLETKDFFDDLDYPSYCKGTKHCHCVDCF